jgi:hypothetical protein
LAGRERTVFTGDIRDTQSWFHPRPVVSKRDLIPSCPLHRRRSGRVPRVLIFELSHVGRLKAVLGLRALARTYARTCVICVSRASQRVFFHVMLRETGNHVALPRPLSGLRSDAENYICSALVFCPSCAPCKTVAAAEGEEFSPRRRNK